MADSDEDTADISNALLLEDPDDNQEGALLSKNKRRKIETEDLFEDLDVFPNESASKTKLSGSSFKNMGFGPTLLKSIARKGYRNPTPIQRKTIPPIMDGRDVVGMARTGSGKTASFVLPMIDKLKGHSAKVGARAIIMAPSRELAIQTLKVVKEMCKGTDLRTALLVGGDSLEEQFGVVMQNPDIVVATPGRFLHLIVEMSLDLRSVQYVVFDEADRLFEMGFETQLTEILHKLPLSRQTLLFSATLPASLVEFAKAGLQDPLLIRLDVDQKISDDLETAFFTVKPHEKQAALLYILQEIIKIPRETTSQSIPPLFVDQSKKRKRSDFSGPGITPHSTLIFVSTKHQVEYVTALLIKAHYSVSHIYGSLDQVARKQNADSFRSGHTQILVVTDVAARGIDIPVLSNVINYDFAAESKIFVHRVGRTARAGQRGWAYSLVTAADAPYFVELVDFLGRRMVVHGDRDVNYANDVAVGSLPGEDLQRISEWVERVVAESSDLSALRSVAIKGEKLFLKTRGAKPGEVIKRAKSLVQKEGWTLLNPLFAIEHKGFDDARIKLLSSVSGFRPKETVFEIGHKGTKGKSLAAEIMRARRRKITLKSHEPTTATHTTDIDNPADSTPETAIPLTSKKSSFRDPEHYIPHFEPGNTAQERGYDVHQPANSFAEASRRVTMNLADDDGTSFAPTRPKQRWDPKKKNFINRSNDEDGSGQKGKMIKGESGVKIPASMKSGRFEVWQNAHKTSLPQVGGSEVQTKQGDLRGRRFLHSKRKEPKAPDRYRDDYHVQKKRAAEAAEARKEGGHLRTVEQVRKLRIQKDQKKRKNARPSRKRK